MVDEKKSLSVGSDDKIATARLACVSAVKRCNHNARMLGPLTIQRTD
jgi:hypothetical protein